MQNDQKQKSSKFETYYKNMKKMMADMEDEAMEDEGVKIKEGSRINLSIFITNDGPIIDVLSNTHLGNCLAIWFEDENEFSLEFLENGKIVALFALRNGKEGFTEFREEILSAFDSHKLNQILIENGFSETAKKIFDSEFRLLPFK